MLVVIPMQQNLNAVSYVRCLLLVLDSSQRKYSLLKEKIWRLYFKSKHGKQTVLRNLVQKEAFFFESNTRYYVQYEYNLLLTTTSKRDRKTG